MRNHPVTRDLLVSCVLAKLQANYHDGNPKARNPVCEPLEAWRYRDWGVR